MITRATPIYGNPTCLKDHHRGRGKLDGNATLLESKDGNATEEFQGILVLMVVAITIETRWRFPKMIQKIK